MLFATCFPSYSSVVLISKKMVTKEKSLDKFLQIVYIIYRGAQLTENV